VAIIWVVHMIFRVSFTIYNVVIDHNDMSPIQMLKHAWSQSKGHVWKLFGVSFLAGLTNILGVLALGV
jgi:uncharacterized membrane protein